MAFSFSTPVSSSVTSHTQMCDVGMVLSAAATVCVGVTGAGWVTFVPSQVTPSLMGLRDES